MSRIGSGTQFRHVFLVAFLILSSGVGGCPPPPNVPPTAGDQEGRQLATVAHNTPTPITLQATDPDGGPEPLRYIVASLPTHGTLAEPGGAPIGTLPHTLPVGVNEVVYTPNAGYAGADAFTFRASDGEDPSNDATVRITVLPAPNVPPTANDQQVDVAHNTPTTITFQATDPDGGPEALRYIVASLPTQGTLAEPGGAPIATLPHSLPVGVNEVVYTPNAGYAGADEFTFRVFDGEDPSNDATVSITVLPAPNVPPTASDQQVDVAHNTPTTIMLQATDPDGGPQQLRYVVASLPTRGTLAEPGGAPISTPLHSLPVGVNEVVYTPNAGYAGADEFTFHAFDGEDASNDAAVSITVAANVPPTASDQQVDVARNTPTTITLQATDPDGSPQPLRYVIASLPTQGALAEPGGTPIGTLPHTLPVGVNEVAYTPTTGYTGTDEFTFRASDGEDPSNDATVSITVLPNRALLFLRAQHDQYHDEWFDVYTDAASAGNQFVCSAMMTGEGLSLDELIIDDACTDQPHSGSTCIRYGFLGEGTEWGGLYRMNGVLRGDDTAPQPNWGSYADAGINLAGATELEFWARGAQGGEEIEFFAFGVGRSAASGAPIEPYPDSQRKLSLGYVTLSNQWQRYVISLAGADLSYVLGAFGWVTNALHCGDRETYFYVDDIRYRLARPNVLRLLQSYVPRDADVNSATLLRNLATTYDNALAVIAAVAMRDLETAELLANALVYAQGHDRWFDDGRLRNGYQAGDLMLPPGWEPHGRRATARIPGWWGSENAEPSRWYEDAGFVGSKAGDLAWPIIALLTYREAAGLSGNDPYLTAAVTLGEWIEVNCRSAIGAGGYTGGFEGWEPNQTRATWKSTEHNLDAYVAFTRLHQATGDAVWLERAQAARTFVEAMWNPTDGHFWTGTTEDGVTINPAVIPLDVQAWAILVFGAASPYVGALDWAEAHCALAHAGYQGFDYDTDRDGIWFEGTGHMAVAYWVAGRAAQAAFYVEQMHLAQLNDSYGDGYGLVATSVDNLTTGFGTTYVRRLHVGATSWLIFAEEHYNPYWGTR